MLFLFSKFIFKIIILIDIVIFKVFSKSNFRFYLYELFRNNYSEINFDKNKIHFFCPSYETKRRVETIFSKEPETIKLIDTFKKKNKDLVFFDVGANIGLYSIYSAKLIDKIRVYSFEPSFKNLSILSRNIIINKLSEKVFIMPFSLIKKEQIKNIVVSKLHESYEQEGSAINYFKKVNNYFVDNDKKLSSYNSIGINLDYLIEEKILPIPDILKIDTDGYELEVISGSQNLLKNCKNLSVQIELNEKNKQEFEEIYNCFIKNGFVFINKSRNEEYHLNQKFEKVYNYYFIKGN